MVALITPNVDWNNVIYTITSVVRLRGHMFKKDRNYVRSDSHFSTNR